MPGEEMKKFSIDKEKEDLIKSARSMPWRDALALKLKKKKPLRYEHIVYEATADWMTLLPLDRESVVLDAGCGWGTLTFQLARGCKRVIALDESPYSAEFVKIRSVQDGVSNVSPVIGNVLRFPFPENSFDLVVLNGVLEWMGLADPSKDPKLAQEHLLREAYRVLKPGGYLYVGIENRWSATYFLGEREGHVNLKFISLLPRKLAKAYHRLVKKSDYRVYTHSLKNYLSMIRRAGFNTVSTYAPVPNYHKYSNMIPLGSINAVKYYVDRLFSHRKPTAIFFNKIVKLFHLYGPLKYFVPCYSFMACKGNKKPTLEVFLRSRWQDIARKRGVPPEKFSYILRTGVDKIILFVFNDSAKVPHCVLKVQRKPARGRLESETEIFKYLKDIKSSLMERSVPDIVYSGRMGDEPVLIENVIPGSCLEHSIPKGGSPSWKSRTKSNITLVVSWLTEFQHLTKSGELILDSGAIDRYFDPVLGALEKYDKSTIDKDYALSRIAELKRSVEGKRIPLVVQHRDFGPSNIFLDGNNLTVLDWVWARKAGESLYDLFYFLSRYYFLMCHDPKLNPVGNFETLAKFSEATFFRGKGYLHNMISELVKGYCRNMKIDIDVAKTLFLWQEIDKNKNFDILNLFFKKEDKFII